ncbi:acyltransferase family protein [Paraburkholderia rhizosphaerae]|uniref:Peptidoglycan/LPS O-acetylase OafA/YrhL n=1 Tax=Paraburkholderia rhizosphaerae TaxID=480658 RepID=A0A4R8L3R1_9BURK|nr:acyltransferase [Paraburkholderia rhizosphaerae]TDY37131.1 peptidoglycan/LPS O-acetylase OafA/YrhL [Paraburkholderia rhizosphaerae]
MLNQKLGMKKIIFADQLRCVAALSVVFVHLFGGYWAWRDLIAAHIMAPILNGPNSPALTLVSTFNFGPFGVSLFFLISGFVISFSLEKMTAGRFLLARAFRIYPTYIACLAIGLCASWLSSRYWDVPFTVTPRTILLNALLINNLKGVESFDLVNWTLAIELKFYIVMAALAALGMHRRVAAFLAVSALIVVLTVFEPRGPAGALLIRDLAFVPYMLIGTVFGLHMRGALTNRQAFASIMALVLAFHSIAFVSNFRNAPMPAPLDIYLLNIAVFALAYIVRDKFRPIRIVDFFARISYPLYAVHPILGYVLLRLLMSLGFSTITALCITLTTAVSIAYAVHRLIERPSTSLGKLLSLSGARPLSAT